MGVWYVRVCGFRFLRELKNGDLLCVTCYMFEQFS